MINLAKALERLEELTAVDAEKGLSDIQRQELQRLFSHYFEVAPEELDDDANGATPSMTEGSEARLPIRVRAKLLSSALRFLSEEVGSPSAASRATEPIEQRDRDKS
jgi:hypothetical protein